MQTNLTTCNFKKYCQYTKCVNADIQILCESHPLFLWSPLKGSTLLDPFNGLLLVNKGN
jgi:hypothetical protein